MTPLHHHNCQQQQTVLYRLYWSLLHLNNRNPTKQKQLYTFKSTRTSLSSQFLSFSSNQYKTLIAKTDCSGKKQKLKNRTAKKLWEAKQLLQFTKIYWPNPGTVTACFRHQLQKRNILQNIIITFAKKNKSI